MNTRTRILILGGGFGGMYAAIHLDKHLARDPDVEITLINRENLFLFTPMLHEVAACDLDITHIVNPIRKLLKHVQFFAGEVEAIDLTTKRVTVSHASDAHTHILEYDHLILGLGSVTNFYNLPGMEENALTMKSLGDAIHLRNQVINNLEEADGECAAGDRSQLLTFVVAGGGFAGVETMAAINDFAREALRYYPNLHEEQLKMVLIHPGDVILPELGPGLGAYAQKALTRRRVDIRTNTKVAAQEGLRIYSESRSRFGIAFTLEDIAALCVAQGDLDMAARLWGTAAALREQMNTPLSPVDRLTRNQIVGDARSAVGAEAFDAAWHEGRSTPWEQAVECALAGS